MITLLESLIEINYDKEADAAKDGIDSTAYGYGVVSTFVGTLAVQSCTFIQETLNL